MITSNEQFKKIVDDRNKYVFIQMGKKLKSVPPNTAKS